MLGTTILYLLRSISLRFLAEAELIGSFITQVISHLLLVLLLSVYVNLVKELFLPKDYFLKKMHFLGLNDKYQGKSAICGDFERRVAKMRVLRMKWGAWKK